MRRGEAAARAMRMTRIDARSEIPFLDSIQPASSGTKCVFLFLLSIFSHNSLNCGSREGMERADALYFTSSVRGIMQSRRWIYHTQQNFTNHLFPSFLFHLQNGKCRVLTRSGNRAITTSCVCYRRGTLTSAIDPLSTFYFKNLRHVHHLTRQK